MSTTSARLTASLLVAAVALATLAFAGLSTLFDYPAVLQRPAFEILRSFDSHPLTVGALFAALAVSVALLAPIAVLVGRLAAGSRLARASVVVGVVAAAVQAIGLARWPLVVPWLSDAATSPLASAAVHDHAVETFRFLDVVLGTLLGETLGYTLTASWTILVVLALKGRLASSSSNMERAFAGVGIAAAVLILAGLGVPLGLRFADLAGLTGYVLWMVWLLGLGVAVWRRPSGRPVGPAESA